MPVEFFGGPLDGHVQCLSTKDIDSESLQTVMAIIGKNKKLESGQRVSIYRLANVGGRYQYHFKGEMVYA